MVYLAYVFSMVQEIMHCLHIETLLYFGERAKT